MHTPRDVGFLLLLMALPTLILSIVFGIQSWRMESLDLFERLSTSSMVQFQDGFAKVNQDCVREQTIGNMVLGVLAALVYPPLTFGIPLLFQDKSLQQCIHGKLPSSFKQLSFQDSDWVYWSEYEWKQIKFIGWFHNGHPQRGKIVSRWFVGS